MIIILESICLVQCSPSLKSNCMVLPYLNGFILIKIGSLSISLLLFLGIFIFLYICRLDLLQVVSEQFLGQAERLFFFAGMFWRDEFSYHI